MDQDKEIAISSFDFQQILPHHSVLIVEDDPDRAAALINRILRTVVSTHLNKMSFEQGEILTSPTIIPPARFRFPKRVQLYDKKTFATRVTSVFQQQGFEFPFTGDPANPATFPLHFLPRQVMTQYPLFQGLSEKQYLQLNRLLRIPRSFFVLHHCFVKTWPKNETLQRLLTSHHIQHRLLFIMSCATTQSLPREICEHFDWIFFFSNQETQWKRWYRLAFGPFFFNAKVFLHFMKMTKPSQGLVVRIPWEYKDIALHSSELRHSLISQLPPRNREEPIHETCISIVKRLRFLSPASSPPMAPTHPRE